MTEILIGTSVVVLFVANLAIAYFVSPTRLILLSKLVDESTKDKSARYLRLALQSLESTDTNAPIVITLDVRGSGAIMPDSESESGPVGASVQVFGPPGVVHEVEVRGDDARRLEITISRLRALKTISLVIPVSGEVARVAGTVKAPRRPLRELIPLLATDSAPQFLREPIEWGWHTELGVPNGVAPGIGEALMGRRGHQGWRAAGYEGPAVLLATLAGQVALYALFVFVLDGTHKPHWEMDAGLLGATIALTASMYALLRPAWMPVAQGYLDSSEVQRQSLRKSDEGSQKR